MNLSPLGITPATLASTLPAVRAEVGASELLLACGAAADDGARLVALWASDDSDRVRGLRVSVLLVDVDVMTDLHVRWMDEPGPTDVLSFPMDELRPGTDGEPSPPGLLGDVVLCPEVAAQQARTAGHSTVEELLLLTVHGILHLLGYDHAEPDEEKEMFALQRTLLLQFHLAP